MKKYCYPILLQPCKRWKPVITSGVLPATTSKSLICLLYTSDAADERSSVDLGGRRIIKKKTKKKTKRKKKRPQRTPDISIL